MFLVGEDVRQTISTVLASNESLTLNGPGFVKVTSAMTVTASKLGATTGVAAKSAAGAKLASISLISGPFIGFIALATGMVFLAKLADDANKNNS